MSVFRITGRGSALVLAAIAWFSVGLQLVLSLRLAAVNGKTVADGIVVYLGYFTVLTNILVCLTLTVPLVAPRSRLGNFFSSPSVLTGVAASIAMVSIAYHLFLREIWAPQGFQWLADVLLHYVVPALFIMYWMIAVPKSSLRWSDPIRWATYPLVFLGYALIRGVVIGEYPYPFIDVSVIGYSRALLNSWGLLIGFVALGLTIVVAAKVVSGRAPDL